MRKIIFTITLFGALFYTANTAYAGGVIIYSNGQKIEVANKLPEEAVIGNEHVNLGVMYDQFSIFWIPIWNYGETKYVLINDKEDKYYDLTSEEIELLKESFDIKISEKPSISFWNKIGGKLIWIVLISAGAIFYLRKRKGNEDAEASE